MRIEIHVLQNFAPSNLNRDDTGNPKETEFGGYRRARISSQCLKRAVRGYFRAEKLIDMPHLAERTKRLASELSRRLVSKGRAEADALRAAKASVSALLPKSEDKGEHKTPYLLFLGESEIDRFADEVNKRWDAFSGLAVAVAADQSPGDGRSAKKGKKSKEDEGPRVPDGFVKAVGRLLDGGKAADLALFGRMLADMPANNVDAACQVAHCLSTNKIHSTEQDYYTAVDDLKPNGTPGADMIGTFVFNSACFYRYANLDVKQLTTNLQGDSDLARKTTQAFLKAFIHAVPTGKQNAFAAHNPPSIVFVTVRTGGPVSLANAFVNPVAPKGGESLVERSIAAMDGYYGQIVRMYGNGGLKKSAVCQLEGVALKNLKDNSGSVEKLIDDAVDSAFPSGGAQ
ncbi:MAG: type I-E CRISPR-associated protein Cas7/Cse4/CasC [Planctomycetaceae bacterium]|nr:type I-E CRISPR-associated protein Cas7/Cse4/CasC [Planctomycetaceae bacterium]